MFSSNATQVSSDAAYIEDVFSTWLYTGIGSTLNITNGIDLAGKGGLVWMKGRSGATDHALYDTARGATFDLASNLTSAQTTQSTGLTGFLSNGFLVGSLAKINTNNATYASWTFREQPKFFDVVTWTGSGITPRVISHNLGSVPGCIIAKRTDLSGDWYVYHRNLNSGVNAEQYWLLLNSTAATAGPGSIWGTTAPTATGFNVGAQLNTLPGSGITPTYVAYLFAHDAGGFGATGADNVISCGSFTTDGSGNATVNLGYEPQWIMYKRAVGGTGNWTILDTMRGWPVGGNDAQLQANTSGAETSAANVSDPNATGFSVSGISASSTFIYIAIRRGPMKTPTSGTSVFVPQTRTGTTAALTVSSSVQPDMTIITNRSHVGNSWYYTQDRLRGSNQVLTTNATDAEGAFGGVTAFNNSSYALDGGSGVNQSPYTYVDWVFRRAPGFFDVVCYTGTGSATTVSHNLGVAPELMIVRRRNDSGSWATYVAPEGASKTLFLNVTNASQSTTIWSSTAPTSSVFSLNTASTVNASGFTYVAYLFASCPGVSKVGSFTGTGATQTINCGFSSGARFVLIKRTDSTGDWYVWDSARGIVAANDPYLLLNSTAAEVTNTDWVDTAASGFELSNAAGNLVNTNGGGYIFLAIA